MDSKEEQEGGQEVSAPISGSDAGGTYFLGQDSQTSAPISGRLDKARALRLRSHLRGKASSRRCCWYSPSGSLQALLILL